MRFGESREGGCREGEKKKKSNLGIALWGIKIGRRGSACSWSQGAKGKKEASAKGRRFGKNTERSGSISQGKKTLSKGSIVEGKGEKKR